MKHFLIISVLFILSANTFAQRRTPWNLRQWDDRKYHFGFTLGYNSSNILIDENDDIYQQDSLRSILSSKQPGFNLGIVASLNFHPQLRLRFVPSLSFQDRAIVYRFDSEKPQFQQVEKRIESTFVSFPLLLKYRSRRINNMAVYALGGFKYSMDMATQSGVDNNKTDEIVLKINRDMYSAEIGGGFDFFLLYFKFGIELKADFGIPNVLIQDNTTYSNPIKQLRTRTFFISLTFEG